MYCMNCGKQIDENDSFCPNCGYTINNMWVAPKIQDKVSVGLVILAVLIPLFGFIYWPIKHRETPKRARACGIAAIISFALSIVFSSIFISALFGFLNWFLYEANI